ncbi:MAG: hypothetical protein WCK52_03870 [Betaproteobacteria bacterium]
MKSSDLLVKLANVLGSNNQELEVFNHRRTARGLQPVTQLEFDEMTVKVTRVNFMLPRNNLNLH